MRDSGRDSIAGPFRRPGGEHPRGYDNWDAIAGVWRNDSGEEPMSKPERKALAKRERRERKKHEKIRAAQAACHDDDDGDNDGECRASLATLHCGSYKRSLDGRLALSGIEGRSRLPESARPAC